MRLPKHWKDSVRASVLQVISLAHCAVTQARGKAAGAHDAKRRRTAEVERLGAEIALLREELRIKDARMERIPPHKRSHYTPYERMAILELRAARGWNLAQTAKRFLIAPATIAAWMRRVDEQGSDALVQLREPVNKFPDFVRYAVQRLKALCPALGKAKIAEMLCRAGLHLGATTVGRLLKESIQPVPPADSVQEAREVVAKRLDDVWHVDLTTVPIASGFWTAWIPNALPQRFPFCWWIGVVVDQFSRRVVGTATFHCQPTSEEVRAFIGRAIHKTGASPQHLICDRGKQFDCRGFRRWCKRRTIQVRYGAVGKHGSIAVVERFIRTLKEMLRMLVLIPLRREAFRKELQFVVEWYNSLRPHSSLNGRTPDEVYYRRFPACRKPRHEPREKWPRGSPCARPWALTRGRPGARLELEVSFHGGRKHLPVVTLKRAA